MFAGVFKTGEDLPGDDFGLEVSFLDFAEAAGAVSASASGAAAAATWADSLRAGEGEAAGFALPFIVSKGGGKEKEEERKSVEASDWSVFLLCVLFVCLLEKSKKKSQ